MSTTTPGFLSHLAERVTEGLAMLGSRFAAPHAAWLLAAQRSDGGFAGRAGGPDLYYTAFALRAMAALRVNDPGPWQRAGEFLFRHNLDLRTVADALSLCEAGWLVDAAAGTRVSDMVEPLVTEALDACRSPTGGYGAEPGMPPGLYHTFLATVCLELLGRRFDSGPWLSDRLAGAGPGGGYADRDDGSAAGSNPTAAALVLAERSGLAGPDRVEQAIEYLAGMQRTDGGVAAHADAPEADLLSTFTAVAALTETGRLDRLRLPDVGRFIRSLAVPEGGFRATPSDTAADVEYSYYGLGAAGLLGAHVAARRRARCEGPDCCCLPGRRSGKGASGKEVRGNN